MDPFPYDENGNVTFLNDVFQSTPKKQTKPKNTGSLKFVCTVCDKEYQKEFYFKKHVASHNKPLGQSTGLQINDDTLPLDLSVRDLSLSELNVTQTFKVPVIPPSGKKAGLKNSSNKNKLICTYCLKPYVCSRSFKTHMRMHVIKDATRRFPQTDQILWKIEEISSKSLTAVANCVSHGENGGKFKQLVGHVIGSQHFEEFSKLIAKELLKSISDKQVSLPSALMGFLTNKMEEILCDDNMCFDFLSKLLLSEFDSDLQSQFLLEFILSFTVEIFKFISKTYRSSYQPNAKKQFELDSDEKQVVFYIAGSIIRGYLKIARRHSQNSKWQNIANVLRSKVLCDKAEGIMEQAQWTADLDRGGLLYVNESVQRFFEKVTVVVYSCELRDGSINYEEVIDTVMKTNISVDWDAIIGDSVSESMSLNLMTDIVTLFCKTCGRGIAKRRLNSLRKKPVISMPTRVAVARRKKK